jgi:DNA-binding CsgD family transcriptional regulator
MISLTPQEKRLLLLVCQDKTNQELSAKMGIAIKSVERLKTSLYKKTGKTSILSLFKWAVKKGYYKWKP